MIALQEHCIERITCNATTMHHRYALNMCSPVDHSFSSTFCPVWTVVVLLVCQSLPFAINKMTHLYHISHSHNTHLCGYHKINQSTFVWSIYSLLSYNHWVSQSAQHGQSWLNSETESHWTPPSALLWHENSFYQPEIRGEPVKAGCETRLR